MRKIILLFTSVFLATASPMTAQNTAPAAVIFSEYGAVTASLTGVAGDPANGALVFKNRSLGNCLACHTNPDMLDQPFHGDVGPPLNGIGRNRSEAELRGILTNAKKTFDGTIMPAYYVDTGTRRPLAGYENMPILSAQEVEDLVAYLLLMTE